MGEGGKHRGRRRQRGIESGSGSRGGGGISRLGRGAGREGECWKGERE